MRAMNTEQIVERGIRSNAFWAGLDQPGVNALLINEKKRSGGMKLYTKTVCPKCLWVKSELAQAGLTADVVNLDENKEAMKKITDAGFSSVPILEVGDELIGSVPAILVKIRKMIG